MGNSKSRFGDSLGICEICLKIFSELFDLFLLYSTSNSPYNEYIYLLSILGMIWGSAIGESASDGIFCLLLPYIFPISDSQTRPLSHPPRSLWLRQSGVQKSLRWCLHWHAPALRRWHQIHTVGNHGGSRRMPEGMGMDRWQPVTVAEAIQPVGDGG